MSFVPVLLLGALLFLDRDTKKKKPGKTPPKGGKKTPTKKPPPRKKCEIDGHMSVEQRNMTLKMLEDKRIEPQALNAAATLADIGGFPKAAACLREEAQRRSGGQDVGVPAGFNPLDPNTWPPPLGPGGQAPPPPGPGPGPFPNVPIGVPYLVRSFDTPQGIAAHYTGDASRYVELAELNEGLDLDPEGNLIGFAANTQIWLPVGWGSHLKPPPPPPQQPSPSPNPVQPVVQF